MGQLKSKKLSFVRFLTDKMTTKMEEDFFIDSD